METKIKTIETRKVSDDFIEHLVSLLPEQLEKLYRQGDFLYMDGIVFQMVHYSMETVVTTTGTKSQWITYWSELYDLQIDLDFKDDTTEVSVPSIDWRKDGF